MSGGEQQADTSFGDPNARPPTPQRTPTTAGFASPPATLFQTPKQTLSASHFDDSSSGWTPRFAEEYSVFNSTPGNFRASSSGGALNNPFAPVSPEPPPTSLTSTGKTKRPFSTERFALDDDDDDTSARAAQLPAAAPSALAPASAALNPSSHKDATSESANTQQQQQSRAQQQPGPQRPAKKTRTASTSSGGTAKSPFLAQRQTQTATPPPSSRGGRKLAPKPRTATMQQQQQQQNQGFPQPAFSNMPAPSPQQQQQHPQLDTSFMTTDDVFGGGYPMAPATAPPIAGPRFWEFDMDASGLAIDVDLAATGTDLFGPVHSQAHRQMGSMDWGSPDQMFQQPGMVAQPDPQQHHIQQQTQPSPQQNNQKPPQTQSARRERPLAPKMPNMTTPNMQSPNQSFDFGHMPMSMDNNPFHASPGGVDPGMLMSQPPLSAGMDSSAMSMSMPMSMDNMPQPTSSAPANMEQETGSTNTESLAQADSVPADKEPGPARSQGPTTVTGQEKGKQRKQASRSRAISPTKNNTGRPQLSRSFSESSRGGKRTAASAPRSLLPALAPVRPVTVHQPTLPPPQPLPVMASQASSTRPQTQGGPSGGGRRSPLKSTHHHRLSSLTSIPENASRLYTRSRSAKRTSVKFVIDDNGRARAETVVDEDNDDEDDDNEGTEIEAEPEMEPTLPVSSSQRSAQRNSWAGPPSVSTPVLVSDDEEYSSSSDDEPIIIPSRNTSFNYPDPPKSSGSGNSRPPTTSSIFSQHRIHHRSFSDRHSFHQSAHLDPDHDSMDVDPPPQQHQHQHQHQQPPPPRPSTGSSLGDAASELRKIMQAGNPRRSSSGQQPPPPLISGGGGGHRQRFTPGQRSGSSTISEASLPGTSPTHGREQSQVRCVCNRPEAGDGVFLVKCDSCDSLLHGRCVDMPNPQDRPHVYICAFCANTPNMRGGRMRYTGTTAAANNARSNATGGNGGVGAMMGPPVQMMVVSSAAAAAAAASSPLAHKSFRAFR